MPRPARQENHVPFNNRPRVVHRQPPEAQNDRREDFRRLASSRLAVAQQAIRRLATLNNPIYHPTAVDRDIIRQALQAEVEAVCTAFDNPGKPSTTVQFD